MWSFFTSDSCETTNISISHSVKAYITNSISISVTVIYLTTTLQGHILTHAIIQFKLSSIHYLYILFCVSLIFFQHFFFTLQELGFQLCIFSKKHVSSSNLVSHVHSIIRIINKGTESKFNFVGSLGACRRISHALLENLNVCFC